MKYLLILLLSGILAGCGRNGDSEPKGLIPVDSMALILADIHIVEAMGNYPSMIDSVEIDFNQYYLDVLKKHGVNAVRYDSSYSYYVRSSKKMDEIYERVLSELSARENAPSSP